MSEAQLRGEAVARTRASTVEAARVPMSVVALFWVGWIACLLVAAFVCRSLFADGAYAVLELLQKPMQYIDYDAHRSFASFVTQTPIVVGERLGLSRVSTYAGLYTLGIHALPAVLFLVALSLARQAPVLFAATAAAIVVFGFGANFINTEANLFFALAWLVAVILALPGRWPLLRGFVLPSLAFLLLRVYEGMLLTGPVLAAWAFLSSRESRDVQERIGLTLAALAFGLGTLVGFSSIVSPRDPGNAAGFAAMTFRYVDNPQVFVLAASLAGLASGAARGARQRAALVALTVVLSGAFVVSMLRQEGYYAYGLYYYNRAFLVLLLPLAIAVLFAVRRLRARWLSATIARAGVVALVVPFAAVVAVDGLGSARWFGYVNAFCAVLERPAAADAVQSLKRSGAVTGWGWTHPALSILLRKQGSAAVVRNEAGQWQPFDPDVPIAFPYQGACENRRFAASRRVAQ